jgi:hypothetical protein
VGSSDGADLHDAALIRARCAALAAWIDAGRSRHWLPTHRERLDAVADRVAAVTRRRYPDLRIPLHSRWRHFEAGGVDRAALMGGDRASARARIDLVVVSVLLDAGAGAGWRYRSRDGGDHARSEGLGVASFEAFVAGAFSATAGDPMRADAAALARVDARQLGALLQVRPERNPLVGLDGRAALLARLGAALGPGGRPADLLDRLPAPACRADTLLREVLRLTSLAFARPDAWAHPAVGVVPFHKLSQWLAYSLIEPLRAAGVDVTETDRLTGLPEYRNGGLFIDAGVIEPRSDALLAQTHRAGDEAIVEWRALTVALLDELLPRVRARLGMPGLPLACLLEGGSWAAGREMAAERRPGSVPPLAITSDGTVF